MEKYYINLVLSYFIALNGLLAQQQEYPHLWNVVVNGNIFHNKDDQMFYYAYTITNDATNRGKINEIEIDISKDLHSVEIDTIGLRFENDGFTERSFRRHLSYLKGKIIPIGFLRTPPGKWNGVLTNALTASFAGVRTDAILPGQTLSGFELMSKGLPGIRRFTASPYFDVIALFPDPNDTTVTYYVPPVDSVRQAVKFRGWTIGPTAPPVNFDPHIWCDTLVSHTRQSVQLGWLKSTRDDDYDDDEQPHDGVAKNIEKRLEKAKKELIKGDSVKARKELEKLVKKVEKIYKKSEEAREKKRESEVTMTSEAYALLKFNAEYLIERLPEKSRERPRRDRD